MSLLGFYIKEPCVYEIGWRKISKARLYLDMYPPS